MSSRFYQLQTEAAYSTRPSSRSPNRPGPTATQDYHTRGSTSSDSSSSSGSSSYSSSFSEPKRYSMDSAAQPRVEILRCSRCAKCVETITTSQGVEDASVSGMVKFGHNLYYCDRCARMVGYKWIVQEGRIRYWRRRGRDQHPSTRPDALPSPISISIFDTKHNFTYPSPLQNPILRYIAITIHDNILSHNITPSGLIPFGSTTPALKPAFAFRPITAACMNGLQFVESL